MSGLYLSGNIVSLQSSRLAIQCSELLGITGIFNTINLVKHMDVVVGIGVFRGIIKWNTPLSNSTPIDKGVTFMSTKSRTLLLILNFAAKRAAPYATASSGLTLLQSSLPLKYSRNILWIIGRAGFKGVQEVPSHRATA